jgi:hypothetical protein
VGEEGDGGGWSEHGLVCLVVAGNMCCLFWGGLLCDTEDAPTVAHGRPTALEQRWVCGLRLMMRECGPSKLCGVWAWAGGWGGGGGCLWGGGGGS